MIRMLTNHSGPLDAPSAAALWTPLILSCDEVYRTMSSLEAVYPNFREWYFGKVCKPSANEERATFIKVGAGRILGIGIAKRSLTERKLCTLWVSPDARDEGLGASIADRAFEWLGTRHPLFTVPEERLGEFQGLLKKWDFTESQKLNGYYRHCRSEYVFNGHLQAHCSS